MDWLQVLGLRNLGFEGGLLVGVSSFLGSGFPGAELSISMLAPVTVGSQQFSAGDLLCVLCFSFTVRFKSVFVWGEEGCFSFLHWLSLEIFGDFFYI